MVFSVTPAVVVTSEHSAGVHSNIISASSCSGLVETIPHRYRAASLMGVSPVWLMTLYLKASTEKATRRLVFLIGRWNTFVAFNYSVWEPAIPPAVSSCHFTLCSPVKIVSRQSSGTIRTILIWFSIIHWPDRSCMLALYANKRALEIQPGFSCLHLHNINTNKTGSWIQKTQLTFLSFFFFHLHSQMDKQWTTVKCLNV